MKRVFSAGGIVINSEKKILLTKNSSNNYWGFPKGIIDKDESSKDAALREVKEEGGIEAEIIEKVGESKYVFVQEGEKIFKMVIIYLMQYISGDPSLHDWEVSEAGWFSSNEAEKKLSFSQDKKLLEQAVSMYNQHTN